MIIPKAWLPTLIAWVCCFETVDAQPHPLNQLGRAVFDSFRNKDFATFHKHSVFSFGEDEFETFLRGMRNDALRADLRGENEEAWDIAFAKNWRKHWLHVARHTRSRVRGQAFDPIQRAAEGEGIQWETTKLTGIEVLLPVTIKQKRFEVKRDTFESSTGDARTLWLDRGLVYRLRLDPSTHGNAFMIGLDAEDSKKRYDKGIRRNGAGAGDIILNFNNSSPSDLFYFCPDQKGIGGSIRVTNPDDLNKPNQRLDLLLTFNFGRPTRTYQILVRETLSTPSGPRFFERPKWLGETLPIVGLE